MNRTETSHTPLEGTPFLRRLTLLGSWLTSSEYTFPLHLYVFCFGDYIHSPRQCGSFQTPLTGCVCKLGLCLSCSFHTPPEALLTHTLAPMPVFCSLKSTVSPTNAHSRRPLLWPLVKTLEPLRQHTRKAFSRINFPSSDF